MSGLQRIIGVALASMVAVPVAPVVAQERLALEEAIARGLQHSARLAELQAREAAAAAAEQGRAAADRPLVSAIGGYTRTNHVEEFSIVAPGVPPRVIYPDIPDNVRARLDLQWPIYTAGRFDALERAARAERGAVAEDLAAARADLRLEITRAFWALVTARESEQVLERSVGNLEVHIADLRVRLEQGLIPPNDVLTAEAQRSRRRGLRIEASGTRAIAEADLRRLIGGQGPILPVEPSATPASDAGVRPERRALDQRLAAAREREAAVQAQFKPQVSFGAGYDYARPNPRIFPRAERWDDSWDISLNASWTLWDGGRRGAERAEARAGTRAIEARITELDRQTAFEVEARRLDLESARAVITAADDGIRAADEARRVVDERYRAGVATSTDVLDAEMALLQAQLDRTRALASARLAEARLARAQGSRTP
jgi:outer membrane protein TolC